MPNNIPNKSECLLDQIRTKLCQFAVVNLSFPCFESLCFGEFWLFDPPGFIWLAGLTHPQKCFYDLNQSAQVWLKRKKKNKIGGVGSGAPCLLTLEMIYYRLYHIVVEQQICIS